MNRLSLRRRSAFSILEVLMTISVTSLLLTLLGIWLHKVLLFSGTMLERQRDNTSLHQLAGALRQDVQLAKHWSFRKPDELTLVLADNTEILYRLTSQLNGSQIEVVYPPSNGQRQAQDASATQTIQRKEVYRFTPRCRLNFDQTDFPASLSLIVRRMPNLAHALPDKGSSGSSAHDEPPAAHQTAKRSAESPQSAFEQRPVEAVLKLSISRWNGQVHRLWGDLP